MMTFRTVFLAALVAPLAFGEYQGGTRIVMRPCIANSLSTLSNADWGGGSNADGGGGNEGPTCGAPTQTFSISTLNSTTPPPPTDPRACTEKDRGQFDSRCYKTNEFVPGTNESGTCNKYLETRDFYRMAVATVPSEDSPDGSGHILVDCSPTGRNCTVCFGDIDLTTGEVFLLGCCNPP